MKKLFLFSFSIFIYFYFFNITTEKVHIYIIDSEIDIYHREFRGRADIVYSISNCTNPTDHGTHLAGIIGGNTIGITKNVILHSVSVIDCNSKVDNLELAKSINWIVDNKISSNKPSIINMALIPDQLQIISPLEEAIRRAINSGIIFVVSAGNDGIDRCQYTPLNIDGLIIVGSIGNNRIRSSFSNYGDCISLYTEGENVWSSIRGNRYGYFSGTSQAAPRVTGLIAQYITETPGKVDLNNIKIYLESISMNKFLFLT